MVDYHRHFYLFRVSKWFGSRPWRVVVKACVLPFRLYAIKRFPDNKNNSVSFYKLQMTWPKFRHGSYVISHLQYIMTVNSSRQSGKQTMNYQAMLYYCCFVINCRKNYFISVYFIVFVVYYCSYIHTGEGSSEPVLV